MLIIPSFIKCYLFFKNIMDDTKCENCGKIYTIISFKWCKPCQINNLKKNFANWTSGNEKIDKFIQEMQLEFDIYDIVIEWIPYDQFNNIKEITKGEFTTVYSAIWVNGPLDYEEYYKMECERLPNENVVLKRLYNSQNMIDKFLNEVELYSTSRYDESIKVYGISQSTDTKDYIIVLQNHYCKDCIEIYTDIDYKWCNPCQTNNFKKKFANWTSGNEKIDKFIHEIQSQLSRYGDIIVEWIPYIQFSDIKEVDKDDFATVYSAIWTNGSLNYDYKKEELERISNERVTLKCLYNSQNIIDQLLNEQIMSYSTNRFDYSKIKIYGVSQNSDTKDYIIVLQNYYCKSCNKIYTSVSDNWCKPCQIKNFANWTSGNEKIDELIQKTQLKITQLKIENSYEIIEWIPYNQFNNIIEIGRDDFVTVYSAIWINGPLGHYNYSEHKGKRLTNAKVTLKYLYNSQNISDKLLNEVELYSDNNNLKIYGISQNPNTSDYIIVLEDCYCESCGKKYINTMYKWCELCQISYFKNNFANWTSGNGKIDELIQEMQLKINSVNILIEWIPYDQFNNIKEISKDDFSTVYLATWVNGLLNYNYDRKWKRISNKKVALKCLHNSRNNIDKLLDEVKSYSTEIWDYSEIKIYGISQNPDTNDYIIILQNVYCKSCNEIYTNIACNWCRPCQIKTKWISKNEKINELIQEMQLNLIDNHIIEWIPYDQFSKIKEISKDSFNTMYSAIWIDGSIQLYYGRKVKRASNQNVILKCIYNSQNITNEFLNEVKKYYNSGINRNDDNKIPKVYGISQNPDTKDYIIVLQDCNCKTCGEIYADISHKWCKLCQMYNLNKNFVNWTSGNKIIDKFIQDMQLKIDKYGDMIVEWIPYNQFNNIKEIGEGGFATVYSAIWKDGPIQNGYKELKRMPNKNVALKCLHNSQNITNKFLDEAKKYSISIDNDDNDDKILKIYGISQNPDTKDYIIVLQYANGGNFYIDKHWYWFERLVALGNIIRGLKKIHENNMVHRDFHTGNILLSIGNSLSNRESGNTSSEIYISDMGLCGEVDNIDETKVYGVMPYVAPEVLRGKPYTKAADIYSFGMIMYFVATTRQPFDNCAHDDLLVLNICNGIRPEINELKLPKCYIDLMKRCWDSDPNNRPSAIEIKELIISFQENREQFEVVENYRRANLLATESNQTITHPQAYYTSRLLNPFTKDLPKYDDINNIISVEVTDFMKLSNDK
ncbi:hypothetical protein RclHR1_04410004 [Rhizophagus clarus]|uniref:Protein kinase domain-containing protein n=1 Tax=Rhizophagus clarus TaxID=94130 RepID=A0A2Z6RIV5_9GLOM|nr:hypothetical protein RclHR1_04410004 [Rhizophagus clarus]